MDLFPTHYDKHNKIWSGAKMTPVYHPDCSIGKIVFNALKNWPKNVMQISDVDGSVVTNYDMLNWSIRIAQYFKKLRLRHDDVIGIAAKNSKYVSAVATGALFNASPFHAVNPAHDEKTLSHLYGLTKPKVIFCDGDVYDKVYQATKSINPLIYTLSEHFDKVPTVEELLNPTGTEMFYTPEPAILGNDQTMVILCSSGTTGLPKAVCLSNSYLKLDVPYCTNEDIIYNSSTLDWLTGLWAYMLSVISGCTRIITNKPFSAEYFVELIKKYEVTWTMVAPRHLSALINCPTATPENLRTVRLLSCGGGYIALPTLQRTEKIFPNALINFGYGLTETGGVSSNIGLDNGTSVGKISANVRVRIVDSKSGKNLGPNEVGEIYVNNGQEWNGYYSNPMETQRIRDSMGWFHTGDLGYIDDKHYLYVVDRLKDICKYQGVQYWPNEIEEEVLKMPEVADACVFGVYDEQNGDKASALVVRANGSKVTEADIKQHIAKKFTMLCKQLHGGVIFTDKLPQSANGKSDRRAAKEIFIKLASNKNNVDR